MNKTHIPSFDTWTMGEPVHCTREGLVKEAFALAHPWQIYGDTTLSHIVSAVGLSPIPDIVPWLEKGLIILGESSGFALPKKPRVHMIGLGDVGIHAALGLYLLAPEDVELGFYARSFDQAQAMTLEFLQMRPYGDTSTHTVYPVKEEALYDCDMLVFAASAGVPKTLQPGDDVRMMQRDANAKILQTYLDGIKEHDYQGMLFILSDPVDALCKYAADNLPEFPKEQILGLGLGVMAARAYHYAEDIAPEYRTEGAIYGPHGEGLLVINSLSDYDETRSIALTKAAKEANLAVRALGEKPFYAPSISSGSYSLLHYIQEKPFYAAMALGDVYFGCPMTRRGKYLQPQHTQVPECTLPRFNDTYEKLKGGKA